MSNVSQEPLVLYEIVGGIARVTLNRPQVLNARNPEMRQMLISTLRQADEDPAVRVLVVAGAGEKAFCTGMDLKSSPPPTSVVKARQARQAFSDIEALAAVRKPTIAALHGYVLGGGLELALACDFRIASYDARLGLPEVTRGLIPGSGGTQRLPRLIGVARALELILSGQQISAERALGIGLIHQAVERAELLSTCMALASRMAQASPVAVRYAKEAILKGNSMPLADGLDLEMNLSLLCSSSEDYAEGVKAFAEKRPPQFPGC